MFIVIPTQCDTVLVAIYKDPDSILFSIWTLMRAEIRAYIDALQHYGGGPAETEDMHTEVEPREAEAEKPASGCH